MLSLILYEAITEFIMSREYAEKRIKEALKKTGGNALKARQQVIAWTYEDAKLLHALTKAHLTGIVAYNIERILSGRGAAKDQAAAESKPRNKSSKEENFGTELLKAVAGNSGEIFGFDSNGVARSKRPKVSKSHIQAIQAITGNKKTKTK